MISLRAKHLLLLALTACGEGNTVDAGPTARDSAGVRIVENTRGVWRVGDVWSVAPTPRLDIGGVEGDSTQQLFRVVDALRLPDGRIVVANGGSQELLFYDSTGAYLLTAGGRGGGPGEFQALSWIALSGDSLIVADRRPARLSVFGLDGRFVRSSLYRGNLAGVFADGSVLSAQPGPLDQPSTGMMRPPNDLLRLNPDGESVDTISSMPGNEAYIEVSDRGISILILPFVRSTWTIVRGETFYVADSDRYDIRLHGADGALRMSIRKTWQPLPVTDADVDAYIAQNFPAAADDDGRRQLAQQLRAVPRPDVYPAFGWNISGRTAPVLLDDVGNLWVLEYNRLGDDAYRWSVFDREGRWLGEVTFPVVLEPLHVGDDFVLGKWRDELDVEHVGLYELSKP